MAPSKQTTSTVDLGRVDKRGGYKGATAARGRGSANDQRSVVATSLPGLTVGRVAFDDFREKGP
jgi:hypothetical protein